MWVRVILVVVIRRHPRSPSSLVSYSYMISANEYGLSPHLLLFLDGSSTIHMVVVQVYVVLLWVV